MPLSAALLTFLVFQGSVEAAPAIPASEAVLSGAGDVLGRKNLGKAKLEGTDFGTLADLAGSWVFLYEVRFDRHMPESSRSIQIARIERASALGRNLAELGLVVIAVTNRKRAANDGFPALDHPLWVTSNLNQSGDGKEPLLDLGSPSEILVDPIGLAAEGGRVLPALGIEPIGRTDLSGTVETVTSLCRSNPALPIASCPPGAKLRKAIAARTWDSARALAESAPEHRQRLDELLAAQVRWAEAHAAALDVCSAEARMATLKSLPEQDPLYARVQALRASLGTDPRLVAARKLQAEVLELATLIDESTGYQMTSFQERDYQKLHKAAAALEAKQPTAVPGVMVASLRKQIDAKSPFRPCTRCQQPLPDCRCK